MSRRGHRSPKRIGRSLRVELREVVPRSKDDRILSRGGSKRISREDMLMPTHFLVPEAEEEAEEELSHVLRVVRMGTKPWTVRRGRWTEEKIISLRRSRSVMLRAKMRIAEDRWACTKFF